MLPCTRRTPSAAPAARLGQPRRRPTTSTTCTHEQVRTCGCRRPSAALPACQTRGAAPPAGCPAPPAHCTAHLRAVHTTVDRPVQRSGHWVRGATWKVHQRACQHHHRSPHSHAPPTPHTVTTTPSPHTHTHTIDSHTLSPGRSAHPRPACRLPCAPAPAPPSAGHAAHPGWHQARRLRRTGWVDRWRE